MGLKRFAKPECPKCGCEDSDVIGGGQRWWGKPIDKLLCTVCANVFFGPAQCPECGGQDIVAKSSPVRFCYQECRGCKAKFKRGR
jgi:hypothetical protein